MRPADAFCLDKFPFVSVFAKSSQAAPKGASQRAAKIMVTALRVFRHIGQADKAELSTAAGGT
jgi:hypothetical protein